MTLQQVIEFAGYEVANYNGNVAFATDKDSVPKAMVKVLKQVLAETSTIAESDDLLARLAGGQVKSAGNIHIVYFPKEVWTNL